MTLTAADLAACPARYFAARRQRDVAGFFAAAWSGFPGLAIHPLGVPLLDSARTPVRLELSSGFGNIASERP